MRVSGLWPDSICDAVRRKGRRTVFLLMMLPAAANLYAAAGDTAGFRFGAKTGVGTTYLTHHHLYMLGNRRVTFAVGFTGEYWFRPWFAARLSVEYTHKGGAMLDPRLFYAKDDPMLGIPELNQTLYATNLTIHTVEIPLTACFAVPSENNVFRPFVVTGFSFGHNFYARADNYYQWEFEGAPNDLLDETSDFVIDRIALWNASVVAGLGTEIKTKKRPVFEAGFTFRMGMTYEDDFFHTLIHKYSTITTLAYIGLKF